VVQPQPQIPSQTTWTPVYNEAANKFEVGKKTSPTHASMSYGLVGAPSDPRVEAWARTIPSRIQAAGIEEARKTPTIPMTNRELSDLAGRLKAEFNTEYQREFPGYPGEILVGTQAYIDSIKAGRR
jgi:hypothetical protein